MSWRDTIEDDIPEETQETSSWRDTIEDVPEEDTTLEQIAGGAGGAVVGGGAGFAAKKTGELIGEGISTLGEKVRDAMPISREDAKFLENLPFTDDENVTGVERYKKIAKEPGTVSQDLLNVVEETRQEGYTATKEVPQYLKEAGIEETPESFRKVMEEKAAGMKPVGAKKAKKAQKAQKKLAEVEKNTEKAVEKFSKEEAAIKSELEVLEDKMEELKQKNFQKQELDKMRDLEVRSLNEQIDVLNDKKFENGDATASKQINRKIELLRRQKRKLTENMKKEVSDIKKSGKQDYEVLQDLRNREKELQRKLKNEVRPSREKTLSRLEELRKEANLAVKETAIVPTQLDEATRKAFDDVTGFLKNADTIEGDDLVRIRKSLSDRYGSEGYDKLRNALSDYFKEKAAQIEGVPEGDTYIAKQYKRAAEAIANADNLEDLTAFRKIKTLDEAGRKGEKLVGSSKSSDVLAGLMTEDVGMIDTERKVILDFLDDKASKASSPEMKKFYNTLKTDLDMNRIAKALSKSDAAELASKGLEAGISKMGLAGFIKKAAQAGQESLLTTKTGRLAGKALKGTGTAAKVFGKGLLKSLPVVGAVAGAATGFSQARAADLPPEEVLAETAIQAVNPLGTTVRKAREQIKSAKQLDVTEPVKVDNIDPEELSQAFKERGDNIGLSYSRRLDEIKERSENEAEYNRKLGMLVTEPAFKELVRRRRRKLSGEEDVDGQEN